MAAVVSLAVSREIIDDFLVNVFLTICKWAQCIPMGSHMALKYVKKIKGATH